MGRTGRTETAGPGECTPNLIRAACRARFYAGLDTLATIAGDAEEKAADRVRALDTLGRFGLGAADQAQVHIHAGDGATIIGVVRLPALGEVVESERHGHPDSNELQEIRGREETPGNEETAHASGPDLAPSGPLLLTSGNG